MSEDTPQKSKRHRSPNHPIVDLGQAIELANVLHSTDRMHEVPFRLVVERWDYNSKSSMGGQCVAALKSFGLIEIEGQGDRRKIRVSAKADRILGNAPDRNNLIKEAAINPPIHRELFEKYKASGGLPQRDVLQNYLLWERESVTFNDETVQPFIDRLITTFELAKVFNRSIIDKKSDVSDDKKSPSDKNQGQLEISVGNYVQWTSKGVDQFESPRKFLGISDDGLWALVEGSKSGLPMKQLTSTNPPEPMAEIPDKADTVGVPPVNPYFQAGRSTEEQGPVINFPLSSENAIEIRLKAPISNEEFDRILKLIELSKDSLVKPDPSAE